ncbi:MAG: exo-alpha-sialidase [Armatimonadia bacterium]|nr:exo-alpha-sialidase [Armatimonadia bacterium]
MKLPDYDLRLDTISEGYDRETEWFQPRIGIIPPFTAVMTLTRTELWGSDIFTAIREFRSEDLGETWEGPIVHETLGRRPQPDGTEVCPGDMTPAWHAETGRLLATGHTAVYGPGERGTVIVSNTHRREIVWSVYDEDAQTWSEWQTLPVPDEEKFFWASAGCAQRVDLEDGTILLPISRVSSEELGSTMWRGCFTTTVLRCSFDGATLSIVEQGNEMTVRKPRGLYEPSLARWRGRFFLTLRNDDMGYVCEGDGLDFAEPKPWRFNDGTDLGSYNTQQHWVTHSDGLFLTYTRRGANNDHVVRHRAPIFLAQVDPDRLCVIRETERVLVPDYGAQLGNFGACNASPYETWVVTTEGMHGDAQSPYDIHLPEARGARNRIWLARIQWRKRNEAF